MSLFFARGAFYFAAALFYFYPRQAPTSCVIRGLFTSTRQTGQGRRLTIVNILNITLTH
ncbi:hypothetical protein C4K05_3534 [Pseudomonas chlororaphis subsp. aureofaciens]|uniref:Uncharacterized protein n=1 Tax=Pseudomonas chlororaphis subsp. aureofaciens TaxID=587851 RepID=A0AAD0ZFA2_9PSED|nr:hypothetical protein C4K08_3539 [Pseudomonas chlororaphis subsp. aureofaciens]AZE30232.1 hypothetical protein C4K07_3447 [Pseudomonas chlororaphis subsp. aureofaciens]AZE36526.1 hypothetical protein C4K06_3493 [Pseudomonas chlororaphis subsp. aureofaciens]AZE42874.1 hypothetical protein C4K05_3534 [Pseudomonas chlororaphis subsp. aureofaciens]